MLERVRHSADRLGLSRGEVAALISQLFPDDCIHRVRTAEQLNYDELTVLSLELDYNSALAATAQS